MTSGTDTERSTPTRLAVLWLAGVDLRVTMLALPPLLILIHRDLGLSEAAVGALTTLPALMMAAAAVPGSLLIARAGARRAAIAGLVIVAVSAALRGVGPSVVTLFAMTLVMGAGIAVMQPAVPALVARWCPDRVGFATALYVNGLLVGETLSAALTLPLVLPVVRGNWPAALAVWSVLPLLTAGLVLGFGGRLPDAAVGPEARWWPDWGRPETWRLGLILGGVGTAYFGSNAFIPDYLRTAGRADLIGPCLAALNAGQLPASAIALVVARAITGRRAPLLVVPAAIALSLALFLAAPPSLWVPAAGVIGFCCAFGLVLSMALPPLVAEAAEVHHVSAGMFASGYAYSFLLPLLGGVAWDVTRLPAAAFLPAFAGAATTFAAALGLPRRAGPGSGEIREVAG
ncbi:MAG TPA: MFS transporter [bacterium]|nr:MFS transporter [bacterium]